MGRPDFQASGAGKPLQSLAYGSARVAVSPGQFPDKIGVSSEARARPCPLLLISSPTANIA
jgi:hypothetical protein